MIRFPLFGIPVEIQPFFWVTSALLGGALNASTSESIIGVVLFMIAAFISILVHELGHATVGMKYAGGQAHIQLNAFGGLAFNEGGRFNRYSEFRMTAAGPGAGFALFVLVLALLTIRFGGPDAMNFTAWVLFGRAPDFHTPNLLLFLQKNPFVFDFIRHMLWINFWWGLINLLPVMPLDGGRIANLFIHPQRRVFQVGMITAAAMAALGYFWMGSIYTAVLFGFLAYQNYQNMANVRWQ